MSDGPGQRQLADFAIGILRQAGADLPRMTDEPIVSWAISALASTVPEPECVGGAVAASLPVSCLQGFETVVYADSAPR